MENKTIVSILVLLLVSLVATGFIFTRVSNLQVVTKQIQSQIALFEQTLSNNQLVASVIPAMPFPGKGARAVPAVPATPNKPKQLTSVEWVRQFGTEWDDFNTGIGVDSLGNIYVTGYSWGASWPVDYDMFVAKYDSAGNQIWQQRFEKETGIWSFGIAVDPSGNAYVTGVTSNFQGTFIAKYDSAGNQVWVKWYEGNLYNRGIAIGPSGNLYAIGGFGDVYISKYDSDGNQLWVKNFGMTDLSDYGYAISVDSSGNAYVTGFTYVQEMPYFTSDALIAKYDSDGNQLWIKWFGTSGADAGLGIAIDSGGNAYVIGNTEGIFPGQTSAGENSGTFIAKYDSTGKQIWVRQFPSTYNGEGIAVDVSGGIYGTGQILIQASKKETESDVIVAKYDSSGNQLWTKQFGTSGDEMGKRIMVDSAGNVYVTGDVSGTFPGQSRIKAGAVSDTFVAKLRK